MKFLLWVLLISSFVSPSFAAELTEAQCGAVDMSERFGPVRYQGSLNFCNAFSAADLIGEALNLKPQNQISALHLISQTVALTPEELDQAREKINFENSDIPNGLIPVEQLKKTYLKARMKYRSMTLTDKGTFPDLTIANAIEKNRVCSEREIPSQIPLRTGADPQNRIFLESQIGLNSGLYGSTSLSPFGFAPPTKPLPLGFNCEKEANLKSLVDQRKPLLLATQDWAAFKFRNEIDKKCKNPIEAKGLEVHLDSFLSVNEKNHIPKSQSRMTELLNKKTPFILNVNACLFIQCAPLRHEAHTVVVTARSWNPDSRTCQIKIRSSWGAGTDACSNALPGTKCENGSYWINSDDVSKSLHEIVWLSKTDK